MLIMAQNKKNILITGGLGQIGYHVYLRLRRKYKICILDNKSSAKVDPPEDVFFIEGDIQDYKILESLPNIKYIIHCAAQISPEKSVQNPIYDAEVNIIGTLNLLEYARKNHVTKFIHISSAATYGDPQFLPITENHPKEPLSPYGLSKLTAENYALLYSELFDLDTTVLLPFNVYSLLQKENDPYAGVIYKFIKRIKEGNPPVIEGDGLQTRDFIHVEDVVVAIELALTQSKAKGIVLNIGSGETVTINELAQHLISISGKKLQPIHTDSRKGDIRESCASIELAQKILGFNPLVKLKEGLQELYEKIEL